MRRDDVRSDADDLAKSAGQVQTVALVLLLAIPMVSLLAIFVSLLLLWTSDIETNTVFALDAVFIGFWAITMTGVVAILTLVPAPSKFRARVAETQRAQATDQWQAEVLDVLTDIRALVAVSSPEQVPQAPSPPAPPPAIEAD